MADYKLTNQNIIIRILDGAAIPIDNYNKDYQKYLTWVTNGHTPDVTDLPFEATWPGIRFKRDALLVNSDWTQLSDSPLTTQQKGDWAIYRQLLRTIPQDYTNVVDVIWPTKPA